MKTGKFVFITFLLIVITAFLTVGTVKSQSKQEIKNSEAYYTEMEHEYIKVIRDYLREEGYANSGVMLTRTVWEDGRREYHITIHNSRFEKLEEEEKENLTKELREKAFIEDNCSFVHSLTGSA